MNTLLEITNPSEQPTAPPPPAKQPAAHQEEGGVFDVQFRDSVENLKDRGSEAMQSAKEAGNQFVDEQKEKFAGRIDHYTEAVKAACETLQTSEGNPLVSPAQRASRQMERAAEYLRSHDAMDFFDDLGNLARRRPEIVFGGLFVLGLASTRFLKASSRDPRRSPMTGRASESTGRRSSLSLDGAATRQSIPTPVPYS